jgi:hypothetical protein
MTCGKAIALSGGIFGGVGEKGWICLKFEGAEGGVKV